MKKIFLAAMAAIALITASCNKTDDDVKIEQITVSNPVINPECMDMYLYEDLEPNIISWSEPEVSDGSKVKFEYQFMISEDDGATWKAFQRQEQTSVAIKKDYRYSEKVKTYYPYLDHNPLPDSENITLNYLDSLNKDINYKYKIRAYYSTDNSKETFVESAVGRFVVSRYMNYTDFCISNNQMTISWNIPKSNLKKIVVFYSKRLIVDHYSEDIWTGKAELDDFYKNNYYKELSPEVISVTFDRPDSKYDFNGVEIVFFGNFDNQVLIEDSYWSTGLNDDKWWK